MAGFTRGILFATCLFALTACETSEQRAEKHYQSAIALLESGDVARAIVEFRNTINLNSEHIDARRKYAEAARDLGNPALAYTQFSKLSERVPDDMEARLALAEMAILAQNWEEAERHGAALAESEQDIEGSEIVALALSFRTALLGNDEEAVRALTAEAERLAASDPQDPILTRTLLEGYLSTDRVDEALALTNRVISEGTENPIFYEIKAQILVSQRDGDALEAHFLEMLEKFPDDERTKSNLIRLLISEGRGDRAEEFLRAEIDKADDKVAAHISVIAIVRQLRGDDAALEEINSALAAHDSAPVLVALKAGLVFDKGQRDEAIELMQSITEGAEPNDEINTFKVTLAKMLVANRNEVGARQLVEAVLENDGDQVEALKMQGRWQIEADQMDEAISTLRLALDNEPEDAEAMTIMARAHERNGDRQLANDLLALAVEASGNAPAESLRFARVQMGEQRFSSAEEILINSLRRTPGNVELLAALGEVYLATSDWGRANQVVETLRRQEQQLASAAADQLQLQLISQREGRDQGIGFLEQLVENSSDNTAAAVALIRARIGEGRSQDALNLANRLVEEFPDDPRARLVLGNTLLALSDFPAAEAIFRSVVEADPQNGLATMQLVRTLGAQGKLEDAESLVDSGLEAIPNNPDLLWAKASFLEQDNDIDGAISVYEQLYEISRDSPVIANNLASLLVTYRTDQASLDRAFAVGRRLRGTDFPPFQDTFGWLLFRQGEFDEAVEYLEPAAAALGDDPMVQFHLAKAYLAQGRNADALAQFQTALNIAGEDDPRPQFEEARAEVERLSAASE